MRRIYTIVLVCILGCASAAAQSMDWLCHPGDYSEIEYLGADLFKIKTHKGKWGIMHAGGEMRVNAEYDSITPFVENRALLLDDRGRRLLGLVDTDGRMVHDFSDGQIYVSRYPHFKDGRLVFSTKDGLYGYMNDSGVVVIEPQYYFAAPYQDGVATVQYDSGYYGLINKGGRSVIVSDDNYPFISSPVDNQVLLIKSSRRGADQLVLMRIDGTNLKKQRVLEDGMNIWLSDDFSTVECQLGHTYQLDDQWRIVSSSHNADLPEVAEEPRHVVSESSTVLSKTRAEDGVLITYLGNPIMDYAFPEAATFDKKYAIVQSKDKKVGVLKLNPSASIIISASQEPIQLYHNELKDVVLDVKLLDVDPSKIKWYRNDQGWLTNSTLEQVDGQWKLRMPYFKASDSYDVVSSENVDIAITYDGLDWLHQFVDVKSLHKPGYNISLSSNGTTNDKGNAKLSLVVAAKNGNPSGGTIIVNGGNPIEFSGTSKTIPFTVNVPEGNSKTFTFFVIVREDGCPDYSASVSTTVQNPARQKKTSPKKEIIIR